MTKKSEIWKKRAKLIALLVIGIVVFSIFKIPCPIYTLSGFLCPGCGMTRAVFALLHFDFVGAFLYNPLVYLLLLFFVQAFVLGEVRLSKRGGVILLVFVLLFGIFRNII